MRSSQKIKFLRRDEVQSMCGLPTSTLYDLMERDEFPKPVKLSARTVAWLEDEVIAWQKARIAERRRRP